MLEFFNIIKNDLFVKNYSVAIGIAIMVDWLMMPIFLKNMGIYVPIALISIYYIISEMAGLIEHYFHNTKLINIFIVLFISDIIQIFVMLLYFYNIEIFTYSLMVVFSFQALLYEIYSIKAIQYMERYSNINISKFQSLLLFNKSITVIIGLVISGIYSLLSKNTYYLVCFIILLSLVAIYSEFKLLKIMKEKY